MKLTHRSAEGDIEMGHEDESFGTQVWFGLVGPVIKAITDGAVLVADELDSSPHPRWWHNWCASFRARRPILAGRS